MTSGAHGPRTKYIPSIYHNYSGKFSRGNIFVDFVVSTYKTTNFLPTNFDIIIESVDSIIESVDSIIELVDHRVGRLYK